MSALPLEVFRELNLKTREYMLELCKMAQENNLDELALAKTGLFWCQKLLEDYERKGTGVKQ